mmetsp:Transcript_34747/g.107503  ORF Transcript_34747/g.107503 Transcript_34747/m.107503 type:complete len:255 (+) Transcript_34747:418-1182(+)
MRAAALIVLLCATTRAREYAKADVRAVISSVGRRASTRARAALSGRVGRNSRAAPPPLFTIVSSQRARGAAAVVQSAPRRSVASVAPKTATATRRWRPSSTTARPAATATQSAEPTSTRITPPTSKNANSTKAQSSTRASRRQKAPARRATRRQTTGTDAATSISRCSRRRPGRRRQSPRRSPRRTPPHRRRPPVRSLRHHPVRSLRRAKNPRPSRRARNPTRRARSDPRAPRSSRPPDFCSSRPSPLVQPSPW